MSHPLYAKPKEKSCEKVPHTAYQVDYVAVNCGRIVAASKRRIRFKFGYSNLEELSAGKTGQACRGSEHEVSITWSLSSGKQAIAFDKHEVYFDVGDSTQTKISHTWKDHLGHTLQVKVHAANVSTKSNPDPDWKQYDLIIDGVSFFRMPKIFQIGIYAKEEPVDTRPYALKFANQAYPPPQAGPRRSAAPNHMESILPPDEPTVVPEPKHEVADLLSFDEFEGVPAPAPTHAGQAMGFAAPPQASQAPGFAAPPQVTHAPGFAAPPQVALVPDFAAPAQAAQPQVFAQPPHAALAPPAQTNNYAPTNQFAAQANPFQAQDQHQGFANNVSPTTQTGAPVQSNPFNNTVYADPAPTASYVTQPNPVTPPESSAALVPVQPAQSSYGVDGAVKNLVNIDNLFGSTAPVTKESVDAKMQQASAHKSLGQLQGGSTGNQKKPVMNPFNAAPAYGAQQQGLYAGGYGAPQQQQQQQQPQFNSFGQQPYAQTGFGYQ